MKYKFKQFPHYKFYKLKVAIILKQKNLYSPYDRDLEDFRIDKYRLIIFRNLTKEIGSKLANKLPKELKILDSAGKFKNF